jgi:hypothetical protein
MPDEKEKPPEQPRPPSAAEGTPFQRYAKEIRDATDRAIARMQGKDRGIER